MLGKQKIKINPRMAELFLLVEVRLQHIKKLDSKSKTIKDCLDAGLHKRWISLAMSCVTSFDLAVLWNGELTDKFCPRRGLRQGDPLSPYLFVFCIEKFSHIINEEVNCKKWKLIKIGRSCPPISHLFLADDLVLFAEASIEQMEVIMNCLNRFCSMSGQEVNLF